MCMCVCGGREEGYLCVFLIILLYGHNIPFIYAVQSVFRYGFYLKSNVFLPE